MNVNKDTATQIFRFIVVPSYTWTKIYSLVLTVPNLLSIKAFFTS